MNINLQKLREKTRYSRQDLSKMLQKQGHTSAHPTQIARYEENPGNVPLDLLIGWLRCLGTTIEEQLRAAQAANEQPLSINPGDPYAKLRSRALLLEDYLRDARTRDDFGNHGKELPTPERLSELVKLLRRKPNIVLSGAFDAGKSTLANWMLSTSNLLPESYTPTTSVITYIYHRDERPTWLKEDVVLLSGGFDPDLRGDQDHVNTHRIVSGNMETLRQYGTHDGDHTSTEAHSAVAYIDSPILAACNIIDFPGYANDESDSKKAEFATRGMDILMYTSTSQGFMDSQDFERLHYLLRHLPIYEQYSESFPTLGNLYIVATHASPAISDEGLQQILEKTPIRIIKEMGEFGLKERSDVSGRNIDTTTIGGRIFPFWKEDRERIERLFNDLELKLSKTLPTARFVNFDKVVREFKESSCASLQMVIQSYEQIINDIESAKCFYQEKLANEPRRKVEVYQKRKQVLDLIDSLRAEHLRIFQAELAKWMNTNHVEETINSRYNDKKEAQQHMGGYIISSLQSELQKFVESKGPGITGVIEGLMVSYDNAVASSLGNSTVNISIPFDARGNFLSGIASLGTVGALGLWATGLGNLGGYILLAQGISALSALGISVGGTAAAASVVSAMGGPITLAIGIGVAMFIIGRAIFGKSWQSRLASQIVEHFRKENIGGSFESSITQFWDESRIAFEQGADRVEAEFTKQLSDLEEIIRHPEKRHEAEEKLRLYRSAESFFAGIPWVSMGN